MGRRMEMTGDIFAREANWRGRGLALARFAGFVVLFLAANFAMHFLLAPVHKHLATFEQHALLEMAFLGTTAVILTFLLARIGGRSGWAYGLGGTHRLRNFGLGAAAGIVTLAGQLFAMHALGCYDFGAASPLDEALLMNALLTAALFLAVGVTEEILFRGYALVELSRAFSFWPAAILLSLVFGIPHWLKGGGANFMGGVQATLFGLAMAFAFWRTGSLWLAIGYHAAWDYGESFIFGVPDSGLLTAGRLLHPAIHGPDWLTGGTDGPEGSVLVTVPILLAAALAWALSQDRSPARAPLL